MIFGIHLILNIWQRKIEKTFLFFVGNCNFEAVFMWFNGEDSIINIKHQNSSTPTILPIQNANSISPQMDSSPKLPIPRSSTQGNLFSLPNSIRVWLTVLNSIRSIARGGEGDPTRSPRLMCWWSQARMRNSCRKTNCATSWNNGCRIGRVNLFHPTLHDLIPSMTLFST